MPRRFGLVAMAVVALATPAAGKTSPCPGGRFEVVSAPLPGARIVIERAASHPVAATVAIDGLCPPTSGYLLAGPGGTSRLRARWASCPGHPRPVRLRARIDATCQLMRGTMRAHGRRFEAVRRPVCGNGALEEGEECDGGSTGDGDCCTTECRLGPGCAPCATQADCPTGTRCTAPLGACAAAGSCTPVPLVCMTADDLVCGCDGNTYRNACEAALALVSVAAAGACPAPCGTIIGSGCPLGGFCELPPGTCSSADLAGTCMATTSNCPRVLRPVCGCDGETYPNDCLRRAYRVQKSHDGACGKRCARHADCGPGDACVPPPGACRGRGECVERPALCLTVFDPVCGCDGRTYSNACVAAQAGVGVAASGPCA